MAELFVISFDFPRSVLRPLFISLKVRKAMRPSPLRGGQGGVFCFEYTKSEWSSCLKGIPSGSAVKDLERLCHGSTSLTMIIVAKDRTPFRSLHLNQHLKNRILNNSHNNGTVLLSHHSHPRRKFLMKNAGFIATIVLSLVLSACQNTQHKTELKTTQDSVSYTIGIDIGKNLKNQMIDVNPDAVAQAIKDINSDAKPMLSEQQSKSVMMAFQTQMMAKHEEKMKEASGKNKKDGETFLAENKKKDGVVTLPSGLQYKILIAGKGRKPKATDKVSLNYRGSLIDGTEFDNSYKRGQPVEFQVGGVIKGLSEVLQLMPVGSTWQVFIPSELGYGEQAVSAQITPNATLIFEIELLGIK